jgi:hypothetical protein
MESDLIVAVLDAQEFVDNECFQKLGLLRKPGMAASFSIISTNFFIPQLEIMIISTYFSLSTYYLASLFSGPKPSTSMRSCSTYTQITLKPIGVLYSRRRDTSYAVDVSSTDAYLVGPDEANDKQGNNKAMDSGQGVANERRQRRRESLPSFNISELDPNA